MSTYVRKLRPVVRNGDNRASHYHNLAVVVHDPDRLGGFPVGAVLSAVLSAWHETLKAKSFTLGTELSIDGARFVVRMGDDGRQRLQERT